MFVRRADVLWKLYVAYDEVRIDQKPIIENLIKEIESIEEVDAQIIPYPKDYNDK